MTLPESINYTVATGYSEEFKRDVYQFRNKTTGIVELEATVFGLLPMQLNALEEALSDGDKFAKEQAPSTPRKLPLIN